ncbi:MAG TPA: biliverdin-producing heme oxygenase [Ramlibacter sp.]|nr:biliverdin-producing heme oxygenase [Ramlibacter sp.]
MRSATREHHHRIDRLVDLHRMQDRSHYARVLRVFDAFLATWEPTVWAALPGRRQWLQARSRRAFLQQDLRDLGVSPAAANPALPLRTEAAAWGSIYVMEGSALGGQVITRGLAAAGLHRGYGAAYFHGWGDATGEMWREARELLHAELAADAALADACRAAQRTFDHLSALFELELHERAPAA